jgi:hypothetical protein
VPTLENFAYGDTPTESALRGVVDRSAGARRSVCPQSDRARRSLTMIAAGVAHRPHLSRAARRVSPGHPILFRLPPAPEPTHHGTRAQFKGEPARFLEALLKHAKRGRVLALASIRRRWRAASANRASASSARSKCWKSAAYGVLEASDLRHRFSRVSSSNTGTTGNTSSPAHRLRCLHRHDQLRQRQWCRRGARPRHPGRELRTRFERREANEIQRIAQVLRLVPPRLPEQRPGRSLRRAAHGAVWPLQPLPERQCAPPPALRGSGPQRVRAAHGPRRRPSSRRISWVRIPRALGARQRRRPTHPRPRRASRPQPHPSAGATARRASSRASCAASRAPPPREHGSLAPRALRNPR